MKEIKLTKNKITRVDDEDYESLNKYKWYAMKSGKVWYAVRKPHKIIMMHREIMKLTKEDVRQVDHKDNNGLNNQKYNLRICNGTNNMGNRRLSSNNTSNYKGVNWKKEKNKWQANICYKNKSIFLGYFNDKIEAAKAYDKKAKELFGEFARINIEI